MYKYIHTTCNVMQHNAVYTYLLMGMAFFHLFLDKEMLINL